MNKEYINQYFNILKNMPKRIDDIILYQKYQNVITFLRDENNLIKQLNRFTDNNTQMISNLQYEKEYGTIFKDFQINYELYLMPVFTFTYLNHLYYMSVSWTKDYIHYIISTLPIDKEKDGYQIVKDFIQFPKINLIELKLNLLKNNYIQ